MSKLRIVLAVLVLATLATLSTQASADTSIRMVNGHVEDMLKVEHCSSPYGICTVGRLTGVIQGDLEFTITSLSETQRPGILFFMAVSTIRTADGDIHCADSGSFNSVPGSDGEGVHLCQITGGTGQYANASGYLTETFNFNGSTGIGDYTGKVVLS